MNPSKSDGAGNATRTTTEMSKDIQSPGTSRRVASAAAGAAARSSQGLMPESRSERDEEEMVRHDVVKDVLWLSSAAAAMQEERVSLAAATMPEEARKKKRGRPPKATAEGDEKKRGGKWVVWYDEDGNEVDRKVKVGCCVAVARLSAVVQRSDFTTRLAIQLRLRSLARAVDFMHR